MKTKRQGQQEKNLQAAKSQLKKDKADLGKLIRLSPDRKLTSSEKRRLSTAVKKAKRDGRIPKTAQQTIPYQEMCRDGICVVNDHFFTKQIQFYDINYQLAQNDDKNQIFENYCDFLNYFDASIHFQLSFLNQRVDMEEYKRTIHIPEQTDDFNAIRKEYSDMLKGQLAKGNNGLSKTKYITFGIEADDLKAAKPRLERIEADILANFKVLGSRPALWTDMSVFPSCTGCSTPQTENSGLPGTPSGKPGCPARILLRRTALPSKTVGHS